VVVDNAEGARRATEHLIRAGHERIGFVGGLQAIQTGAERSAGYAAAMAAAGLEPRAADGGFRLDQGRRATERLLDEGDPTALVVANNLMTIGVLQALRARGARVPDDVALVGMDDPFWAELVKPALTTLAQPVQRMATAAGDLLFERIDGRRSRTKCLVFSFELRVRDSCGTDRRPPRTGVLDGRRGERTAERSPATEEDGRGGI
jgi:DNA-binding LacI/PurR family transcriptional regulator